MKRNGPYPILDESGVLLLVDLLLAKPGIYLRELEHELYIRTGTIVHVPLDHLSCNKEVPAVGFTRLKLQYVALQQRIKFIAEVMVVFHYSMMLWIDETGCDRRNALHKYAYGIRGQRPRDHQLQARGVRYSAIGVLSSDGINDVYIAEGSVNGTFCSHHVATNFKSF